MAAGMLSLSIVRIEIGSDSELVRKTLLLWFCRSHVQRNLTSDVAVNGRGTQWLARRWVRELCWSARIQQSSGAGQLHEATAGKGQGAEGQTGRTTHSLSLSPSDSLRLARDGAGSGKGLLICIRPQIAPLPLLPRPPCFERARRSRDCGTCRRGARQCVSCRGTRVVLLSCAC